MMATTSRIFHIETEGVEHNQGEIRGERLYIITCFEPCLLLNWPGLPTLSEGAGTNASGSGNSMVGCRGWILQWEQNHL